jgi:multimeric flavodoxin WrbA
MKKGLILNFSPNKKGNSCYIAKEIHKNLKKYFILDLINIDDLKIYRCRGCQNYCYKHGRCKIRDDMENLYQHFENDDILVFVTPVYFYHIPGYAKIMIDRCQPYWVRKYVFGEFNMKRKLGSIIAIGATKGKKLFSGINLTMKYFFDIFNIIFDKNKNLYFCNVESKKDFINFRVIINSYVKAFKKS